MHTLWKSYDRKIYSLSCIVTNSLLLSISVPFPVRRVQFVVDFCDARNPYAGVPLAGVAVSPPCLKHTRSTYIKSAK